MDHGRAVTRHYLAAENSLEDGYWDAVFRESSYYENQEAPHRPPEVERLREVGEFDVLLVNEEDKTALYKEVKTGYDGLQYAEEQLERADEHFEEWDILGVKVLER